MAWLALWIGAAFFTALPQAGEGNLDFMVTISESEAPGPLRSLDAAELSWLTVGHTALVGIAVAVACLAVGFGVFLGVGFGAFLAALPRLFLSLSVLIALTGWVAVQNLGGILTGSATDVGTGPVLILLALAFWPAARARTRRASQQPAAGHQRCPHTGARRSRPPRGDPAR